MCPPITSVVFGDRNNYRNVLRNIVNYAHSRIDLEKKLHSGSRLGRGLICCVGRCVLDCATQCFWIWTTSSHSPSHSFLPPPPLPFQLTQEGQLAITSLLPPTSFTVTPPSHPCHGQTNHHTTVTPVNFFPPSFLTSIGHWQPCYHHHKGHSTAYCDALTPCSMQVPTSHLPLLSSYLSLALCVHASHPAATVSWCLFHTYKFLFLFFFFPTYLKLCRTIVATILPPSPPPLLCMHTCRPPHLSTTTTSLLWCQHYLNITAPTPTLHNYHLKTAALPPPCHKHPHHHKCWHSTLPPPLPPPSLKHTSHYHHHSTATTLSQAHSPPQLPPLDTTTTPFQGHLPLPPSPIHHYHYHHNCFHPAPPSLHSSSINSSFMQ